MSVIWIGFLCCVPAALLLLFIVLVSRGRRGERLSALEKGVRELQKPRRIEKGAGGTYLVGIQETKKRTPEEIEESWRDFWEWTRTRQTP